MVRKTTRKRDSQTSTRDLLTAAIEVFAQRGPQAATVDEICRKAGLNKRMLYHYFGSKDQLYQEALRHVYDQFLSLDISLASMLLPVDKLIESLVRQYYNFLRDHSSFVRLICYENLNNGRTARKLKLGGLKAPIITALQLALEKGQTQRRFRRGINVTELLISIVALCFFYFSNEHTMGQFIGDVPMTDDALDRRARHVVDLVLHGIIDKDKSTEKIT